MTSNSKTRSGITAQSKTGDSTLNNLRASDQMVRLLSAMISMDQRTYQRDHTILEMVSMTQQRELFASMMENSSVIWSQERSSGHQKSADITQDNSKMTSTSMAHKIRSSKK